MTRQRMALSIVSAAFCSYHGHAAGKPHRWRAANGRARQNRARNSERARIGIGFRWHARALS